MRHILTFLLLLATIAVFAQPAIPTYVITQTGQAKFDTNRLFTQKNLSDIPNAGTARTNLGVPSLTGTGASGTWGISISGTAANVTTNANLTGPITSVGNATSIASQTGTGTTFVMSAGPTLTGTLTTAVILPTTNNTNDFGSTALRWKDSWFAGTMTLRKSIAIATVTTDIVSIFRGMAAQTGNLTEWQNSSSTILSSISAAGVPTFATGGVYATPASIALTNGTGLPPTTGLLGGNWKTFYTNGSGAVIELANGTAGKVLTTNGASSAPTWETPSAGGADTNALTTDYLTSTLDTVERNSIASAFRIGLNRIGVMSDPAVSTEVCAVIEAVGSATDVNFCFPPKGNGAIMADVSDGSTTGGNARGNYAVDWQTKRSGATDVASGLSSVVLGGEDNMSSGSYSTSSGLDNTASGAGSNATVGYLNTASGAYSHTIFGERSNASGSPSMAGGSYSTASANYSIALGSRAVASIVGQVALSGGTEFNSGVSGQAQSSILNYNKLITGTGISELLMTGGIGGTFRATLGTDRVWNAQIQIVATTSVVGNGTGTLGHSYISNHIVGIKNIGGATALIGAVQIVGAAQSDLSMATSVVTIDASSNALRIQFTPPSTAGTTTVIRVVATVIISEVAY